MQPPCTRSAASTCKARFNAEFNPSSTRSKPGVRQVEPLDQDADDGAVEVAAAVGGRALQVLDADAQDARVLGRADGGAARVPRQRQVGHLAEAFAGPELAQQLLVL